MNRADRLRIRQADTALASGSERAAQGDLEGAARMYRDALEACEGGSHHAVALARAQVGVNLGGVLSDLGRYDEAEAVLDSVLLLERTSGHGALREPAAAALRCKAWALAQQGRIDAAHAGYRQLVDFYLRANEDEGLVHAVWALTELAVHELRGGRLAQARPMIDTIVRLGDGARHSALRESAAIMLYNGAVAMWQSGDRDGALVTWQHAWDRYSADPDPGVAAAAVRAALGRGRWLREAYGNDGPPSTPGERSSARSGTSRSLRCVRWSRARGPISARHSPTPASGGRRSGHVRVRSRAVGRTSSLQWRTHSPFERTFSTRPDACRPPFGIVTRSSSALLHAQTTR